jgi:hypothetical protein
MKKNKHKTQFKFREAILSREKAITAHNRLLAVTGKKLFNTTGPNCSACMITWNEEEMIPYCLALFRSFALLWFSFLSSMPFSPRLYHKVYRKSLNQNSHQKSVLNLSYNLR